jgi:hypothetical protein
MSTLEIKYSNFRNLVLRLRPLWSDDFGRERSATDTAQEWLLACLVDRRIAKSTWKLGWARDVGQ